MKHTIRIFLNGFGTLCALVGLCVFIGAGRASDLGANMATEVVPLLIKGALILFLGILLAAWE